MSDAVTRARDHAAQAQRPAADPVNSVWVAASAGTGKTKVLTDRVLSLMLHGTAPARILCLTFTKAAAAEMANRLAGRLTKWAILSDEELTEELADLLGRQPEETLLETARRLFAQVLDAPGGMKIQTIHAFCQSLLGRFPLEAHIAPHFQVLDERSAWEMLQQAREEVLAAARPDGPGDAPDSGTTVLAAAIAEVSVHAQEQTFTELMAKLISERGQLTRLLNRHLGMEGVAAAVFRVLDVDPAESVEDTMKSACDDSVLDLMGLRLVCEALENGTDVESNKAAVLRDWVAASVPERAASFDSYQELFLTQDGKARARLLTKGAAEAVSAALAVMQAEVTRLIELRTKLNAITVARATVGLLRLGAAILQAYQWHKRARALLDYDDLILGARDLLARQGSASWVLFKLDGGLDHILIDEAQDTNPEQWEVIDMLAAEFFVGAGAREEPRTVFAVGDAKQSIYSFQRADPAAFGRMRTHFTARAQQAGQKMGEVALDYSFRSSAAVLTTVDAVFAQEQARDGVLFGEGVLTHAPVRLGQAGLVELWPPAEPPEAEEPEPWEPPLERQGAAPARTRLAQLVGRKIARWTAGPEGSDAARDDEAFLASRNRWIRPGDVLVLVRRRNEFVEELVRELKRLNVPVAGVDRMVLRDQLAVMDLAALGRVLLLPEDDLTLASVLKGPLVGLSEEQLFTLAHDRKGSLWDALTAQAKNDLAFGAARDHLGALLARADFVPPYELFAEILNRDWGGVRGWERLLARLGPDANDPIEEFLSLALTYEREHAPSLEGFLHWLDAGAQDVKRDMEHGRDAVRVMTVHGAKGLQAPVVILPDTLQVPNVPGDLFWLEEEGGLPLWPLRKEYDGEVVKAARSRVKEAQDREQRRLLYVALTRAEDRLYICGWNTRRQAPGDCWYNLAESALSDIAEPQNFDFSDEMKESGWSGPGWRLTSPQTEEPDRVAEEAAPAEIAGRPLPDWTRVTPVPEPAPPRPLAPSRPAGEEPPVHSPLGQDLGRRFHRGRLIHRLLQSLPDLAPERRQDATRRFLTRPVHDLSPADQTEIEEATLAVLNQADFAPIFGPGSQAEVPVAGLIETSHGVEVVLGQIDRLLVNKNIILIVDYKTNRPAPETEAGVPSLYVRQMAAYQAVLSGVYPGRRIDCALLWTDGPRLMQLSDAALMEYAP